LLTQRIELLALNTPGRGRLFAGAVVVTLLTVGAGLVAWAAEPPATEFAASAQAAPVGALTSAKPARRQLAEAAAAASLMGAPAADADAAAVQPARTAGASPVAQPSSAADSPTQLSASISPDEVAQLAEQQAPRQVVALIAESQLAQASEPIAIGPKAAQQPPAAAQQLSADGEKLMIYVDWPTPRMFLGCLSCAASDPTSIWNPASPYGWTNRKGVWSRQGFRHIDYRQSVCDVHLTYPPPRVFDEQWTFYYRLSIESLSRASICSLVMSREGCSAMRALCDGKPVPAVTPSEWTDVSLPRF
jgi:hypothetical protein